MAERGGVRLRTTVAAVVVVGLALLATSLEMVAFVERSLVAQVADEAALRAEEVADAGGEGPGPLDVADATEQFVQVVRGGRVVGASVNVAGFAPLALPREEQQITLDTVPFASGAFVVVSVTSRDGDVVVVGRSIDDVADARHVVGLALLFGGTTLLLVIGAVTWLIVGRALRPVEDIRLEVEQISASELSRRVPVPGGADEIARLATTMNGMLDRLEAGRDRQRRFISDASHELRSPVASIRQQAEVARAHPNVTAASELADVVLQDVERLQGLVDDLLVLARLDEGAPAELSDVDVDDLVLAEAAWLRSAGTLDVDTRGVSATRVRIDRRQLTRVVHNLVTNAARHARAKIVLSTGERGAIAWLVVADDGPGIAEGDRERVFERFVRSDEGRARDEGGSGLGLAIVYEVVTHYGGSVTLATSELGGLAARVELPFGQATG